MTQVPDHLMKHYIEFVRGYTTTNERNGYDWFGLWLTKTLKAFSLTYNQFEEQIETYRDRYGI